MEDIFKWGRDTKATMAIFRSSRSQVFLKTATLKKVAKFTGKHL